MKLELNNKKSQEFFNDPNVRYPNKPRILREISVYDTPYGLGLFFRAASQVCNKRAKSGNNL
jgi:hypothetical protein